MEEVLSMELDILKTIDFKVNFPTIFDLCRCAFRFIQIRDIKLEMFFQNTSLLVAKTCLFSIEILNNYSYEEIVALSIIMVIKILGKISP
jgi:hypothetical protein